MRKDSSSNLESEFIQGGSHDDVNTNVNDINSVENIAMRNCNSTTANKKKPSLNSKNNNLLTEQRHESSLSDSESSLPLLSCLSLDSGSETAEEPSSPKALSVAATSSSSSSLKPKNIKSVSFSHCSIRSYNQILGDHPLCAVGCPVALGWKVMREETFSVTDFEVIRGPLRKKKGAKSPTQHQRKQFHRHSYDGESSSNSNNNRSMEPCLKYLNSQLKLSAHERRDLLRDYSDAQIRKEYSRMQKQSRKGLINEGRRQFRQVGSYYAGY